MSDAIESILRESRVFEPPSAESVGSPRWLISSMDEYRAMHKRSLEDPEGFWGEFARELHWFEPFDKVVEFNPPDAKWFLAGKTNLCYNCCDRQVDAGHGDDPALIWEGEPLGRSDLRADAPVRSDLRADDPGRSDLRADDPGGTRTTPVRNSPEIRTLTYRDLQRETARFANALKSLGVNKGDVVTIYMGMIPELAIACLACARIGAPHSVIFGGFSAQAIVDRVIDANSKVIITCDGAWRRGSIVPLKDNVDAACAQLAKDGHAVESVVAVKRCDNKVAWTEGRDHWWSELVHAASDDCPCEPMDSEDMLFLLYTSGSTGKPKGIRHTTGGYMVYTYLTAKYVFNLIPDSGQVFWCTADVGWVTGHSYIIYGILPNRVPTLMYEGAPNHPDPARFWDIVERHKVTQFYTAPTAIRAFMKWGDEHPAGHDLTSLQVLGTVGEPINPEAWMWYRKHIGRDTCPIVDTWWQTETGGHMLTPLPGVTPTKPGSCTLPFFGVDAAILDDQGNEQPHGTGGLLALKSSWPAMLRGIHGDRQRYIDTYWSRWGRSALRADASSPSDAYTDESTEAGASSRSSKIGSESRPTQDCPSPYYLAGDSAKRDNDGYFWIMGRIDDVINVAGHRLGTMEVESALVSHESVVEAAVVGAPHEIKGTAIAAFCTLAPGFAPTNPDAVEALKKTLRTHVGSEIGAIAKPDQIRFTDALPKTRSGKIMRRLLRSVAAGEADVNQDTTTLEDYSVLAKLRESEEG